MRQGPVVASRGKVLPRRVIGWAGAGVMFALLAGCASAPEIQTLATGRSDVSAYVLNGSDLDELRKEAGRLCPLGGEVLRQSIHGAPQPAPADGRWRRVLQASALWLDPPVRGAQLLIQCREPGDRMRLVPAPTLSAAASVAVQPAAAASPSAAESPTLSMALPVGPVTPEW